MRPPVGLDEADDEVRAAVPRGDGPPRASGRSCRRRAPCRGRPAAARGRPSTPARTRASISSRRRADVERVALGIGHCEQAVQVEVELEDVDARLAEEPEQRLLGVPGDDRADRVGRHAARRRDPGDLVLGRRRADVRVEARRGGRDQVDGIGPPPFAAWQLRRRASVIAVDQVLVRRAEVRAGRAAGVVAQGLPSCAGRRRAAPEVLSAGERLPDQASSRRSGRPSRRASIRWPGAGRRPGRSRSRRPGRRRR